MEESKSWTLIAAGWPNTYSTYSHENDQWLTYSYCSPLSSLPLSLSFTSLSVCYSCYNCGGLDHHAKECDLPPSQRNATTARASRTWWPSVHTRRWCPLQVLRTPTPLPQGLPGPTSTYRRRRSSRAPPRQRAPCPPQRSPRRTEMPKSGGNPERSSDMGGGRGRAAVRHQLRPCLPRHPPLSPQEPPRLIYLTLVKKRGGRVCNLSTSAAMADRKSVV